MALKIVNKQTWTEWKTYLIKDGYRPLIDYVERLWKKENDLYEIIDQLTKENQRLKEKLGED